MKKLMSLAVITALSLGFSGCASNIIEIDKNKYNISGKAKNEKEIIKEMTEYCKDKDLYMRKSGKRTLSDSSKITYDFKCGTKAKKEYYENQSPYDVIHGQW